jgi:hypothetical protein
LVGLLWTSYQLVAETSTWQHTTLIRDKEWPVGFEPTMPPSKWPQTHASDSTGTGISIYNMCIRDFYDISDPCAYQKTPSCII